MDEQGDGAIPQITGDEPLLRLLRTRVPVDAAALLLKETPQRVEALLRQLPAEAAWHIAQALPERLRPASDDGAPVLPVPGRIADLMESPAGVLREDMTAAGAVDFLVHEPEVGRITYLYVTDRDDRLTGLIVMRDLLLARPGQRLSEFMLRDPFAFTPETPLEDALRAAVPRHYPVYPVVDAQGRVTGLVRGWRLFERQVIEISAQSGQMVGVDKEERVRTPLAASFRMRHPWLQFNLLTAFLSAFVVGSFAGTIEKVVALAAFLPVLAGQAGNTGCQAQAITLRGLVLGDLNSYPTLRLVGKEALLGVANGALTGLIAGAAMWWYASPSPQAPWLALVIFLALTGACLLSGLSGVLVPLTLRRLGADPATASTIFLTTATDVVSMGLMLLLATVLVHP